MFFCLQPEPTPENPSDFSSTSVLFSSSTTQYNASDSTLMNTSMTTSVHTNSVSISNDLLRAQSPDGLVDDESEQDYTTLIIGVVVGTVIACMLFLLGIFWYFTNKKKQVEEEPGEGFFKKK